MPKGSEVLSPNLGLFLDRPPISIPKRGLADCLNVRIKDGRITRDNMGWVRFVNFPLGDPVTLIDNFFLRGGGQFLLLGTTKDILLYDESAKDVVYLTPRYETGTVTVTENSAVVVGVGTSWSANVKAGDAFIASAGPGFREANFPNLLVLSEELEKSTYWPQLGLSAVTQDAATAPDGQTTAEQLAEDNTTGFHSLFGRSADACEDNQNYTLSIYAKPNGRNHINLSLKRKGSGFIEAVYDISAGTVTFTSTGNDAAASIENAGNGWYRCILSGDVGAGSANNDHGFNMAAGPNLADASYAGDGSSGMFLWGAQLIKTSDDPKNVYRKSVGVWYEIASVDSDTQITLTRPYVQATEAATDYVIRQRFTGDIFDVWATETFPDAQPGSEDLWFATNFVDKIVKWNGVDTQLTVTSLPFRCRSMLRFKNMMIYINLIEISSGKAKPFSIANSDFGKPEDVATAPANEFVVHDGVDPLLDAFPLGDNIAIYAERSITLVNFVDLPLLFIFRTTISGIGPLSMRGVADFGDFHEFIGPDAQYRFDGISLLEIGFQVWREILRRQSPQRLPLVNSHFDEENGELLWIMPLATDPDPDDGPPTKAYVEHYLENVRETEQAPISIREIPAISTGFFDREQTLRFSDIVDTWANQNQRWNDRFFQAAFPFNLFGTNDGFVYQLNGEDSHDGAEIVSYARFGKRPLGDARRKGLMTRLYPFAEKLAGATYPLKCRIYTSSQVGEPGVLAVELDYDLTQAGKQFVNPYVVDRFVQVEYGVDGAGTPYTLQGYDHEVVPSGE